MNNLTLAEQEFMYFHAGEAGSFTTALINAMLRADHINLAKIKLGFPELGTIVDRYKNESGYWADLSKRWMAGRKNIETASE
jgi:hypothetical protein